MARRIRSNMASPELEGIVSGMLTHQLAIKLSRWGAPARNVQRMPRCLVIQHVPVERAFAIADALDRAGVRVETCKVFEGDPVPADVGRLDGLVVMGGPMSANSDDGFPSRPEELGLLRSALASGVPTLGVCLGAQLLALAAGGAVCPGGTGPEVGWGEVVLGTECAADRLFADLPSSLTVLQWHGDTFELPSDAVHLASNERYANQAFRVGAAAWGLQFHVEVDAGAVGGFLHAFGSDADGLPGGRAAIVAATPGGVAGLAPTRQVLLGRFARLVAADAPRDELVSSG